MQPRAVFQVLAEAARQHGDAPALYQPTGGDPKYQVYSWQEFRRAAEEIAAGLYRTGLRKGDVVALASETRAELYLADLGIMALGAISVALYTSYPIAEQVRTLRDCGAQAVFVEGPLTLARFRSQADPPLAVWWILLTGEAQGALTLAELRRDGCAALADDPALVERLQAGLAPADPAILYLTSGATGAPKMALVSHQAVLSNIRMGPAVLSTSAQDAMLVFLSSAHITQRLVLELLPILCGIPVWFSKGLLHLAEELRAVEPTIFVAPPRLWERVYTSIRLELGKRPRWVQKLFQAALELGCEAARRRERGQPVAAWRRLLLALADRFLFRQVRARFGRRIRVCGSGSAPLGRQLAEFFNALGLPLVEGYGLTEGGVVTLNPLDRPRAGSVGRPLPGVEARLAEDGELLLRGPTLFSGYYRDPAATAAVLRDGWLHTGDIAEIDSDGYLYITGRKKDIIVASNGQKIFPAVVESYFSVEPIISQVFLVGDRRPYIAALLTVNCAMAETLPGMESWQGKPPEEIACAPLVQAEVERAVARVNQRLAPFEQIRRYRVLKRDFSLEQGELTATLKLRRSRLLELYRDTIAELYVGPASAGRAPS